MAEIRHKEVDIAVIVQIAPRGTDRVAAVILRRAVACHTEGCGHIRESARAVVAQKLVGAQPVAGDVQVEVAVTVKVAAADAARAVVDGVRHLLQAERDAAVVAVEITAVLPDIEIRKPVVVVIAPDAVAHKPVAVGQRLRETVRVEIMGIQQIGIAVVVVIAPGGRAVVVTERALPQGGRLINKGHLGKRLHGRQQRGCPDRVEWCVIHFNTRGSTSLWAWRRAARSP